jgi:pimeloyl-ACP methyl ester carboxylesterase
MSAEIRLDWRGSAIRIEINWVGSNDPAAPVMVFLHEGLGSVSMWKDFPATLCSRLNMRGLVYSRPGYGASSARDSDKHWGVDFMHQQAHEVLPALLQQLEIKNPWLFGHSDGGSIALLYAARFTDDAAGIILVAPHIMVEEVSLSSIEAARTAYLHQGLRDRLARYHQDVDAAFYGWNNIWLHPEFRNWNIEAELQQIRCPLIAIQGQEDEYGSMQQVYGIRDRLPATEVVAIPACGHSPHRDQPEKLITAVITFIAQHR